MSEIHLNTRQREDIASVFTTLAGIWFLLAPLEHIIKESNIALDKDGLLQNFIDFMWSYGALWPLIFGGLYYLGFFIKRGNSKDMGVGLPVGVTSLFISFVSILAGYASLLIAGTGWIGCMFFISAVSVGSFLALRRMFRRHVIFSGTLSEFLSGATPFFAVQFWIIFTISLEPKFARAFY